MTIETHDTTDRFAFGENWQNFLDVVDADRIEAARKSLLAMLRQEDIVGRGFLDIGCGSGLFSLAAVGLGADRVVSIDYDPESVAATRQLKSSYAGGASNWTIDRGDVLDRAGLAALGQFDVVYSWGVLHHTGRMWDAIDNACGSVAAGGALFIAIYNDQGYRSKLWLRLKRLYVSAPPRLRPLIAVIGALPRELRAAAVSSVTGQGREYVDSWRSGATKRGMSRWHNLIDWAGGYPFEVAKPEELLDFCRARGFALERMRTVGGSAGCNELVFRRGTGQAT